MRVVVVKGWLWGCDNAVRAIHFQTSRSSVPIPEFQEKQQSQDDTIHHKLRDHPEPGAGDALQPAGCCWVRSFILQVGSQVPPQ